LKKDTVLLIGPLIGTRKNSYGDGIGGYTRNMSLYLRDFQFKGISIIPFYCTARLKKEVKFFSFPKRFFKDTFGLIKNLFCRQINIIHILGQYRSAIPREFAWVIIAQIFRKPIVYEVKAGMFISSSKTNKLHKLLSNYILKKSTLVLVEGRYYIDYVYNITHKTPIYFPNVVSSSEIDIKREIKIEQPLKFLFVGYCYEGKGIFEVIKAINCDRIKFDVQLEIIGAESSDFTTWFQKYNLNKNVNIIRHGPKSHDFVLDRMKDNFIYIYPSRHPGEGHNNTINEAMMNSMIIISSKAGFLEDILSDCAFLIDNTDKMIENLVDTIIEISINPTEAIEKAEIARKKIENIYNSSIQGKILEMEYNKILRPNETNNPRH
jgi:glycosyltransferase involved in cell wall biosynthesis